eukprot:UN08346
MATFIRLLIIIYLTALDTDFNNLYQCIPYSPALCILMHCIDYPIITLNTKALNNVWIYIPSISPISQIITLYKLSANENALLSLYLLKDSNFNKLYQQYITLNITTTPNYKPYFYVESNEHKITYTNEYVQLSKNYFYDTFKNRQQDIKKTQIPLIRVLCTPTKSNRIECRYILEKDVLTLYPLFSWADDIRSNEFYGVFYPETTKKSEIKHFFDGNAYVLVLN